jgi:hypothetical protein
MLWAVAAGRLALLIANGISGGDHDDAVGLAINGDYTTKIRDTLAGQVDQRVG